MNIGFTAGNERERQNARNFRVVDTFEGLINLDTDSYCRPDAGGANAAYPIVGSIGLSELIATFVSLDSTGSLAGKEGSSIPAMADTIEFTTRVSAGVNPTIELTPLGGNRIDLASAGLNANATREDIHKVIVAVTLPPDPTEKAVVAARGPVPRAVVTRRPVRPVIVRGGKTATEERAVEELDYQRRRGVDERFDRFRRRIERLVD